MVVKNPNAHLLEILLPLVQAVRRGYLLKLLVCLIIDTIGFASYLIPILGEFGDTVWAPIQTAALYYMFGGAVRITFVSFFEEILPFTDILPTATIAWILENVEIRELDTYRSMAGITPKSKCNYA